MPASTCSRPARRSAPSAAPRELITAWIRPSSNQESGTGGKMARCPSTDLTVYLRRCRFRFFPARRNWPEGRVPRVLHDLPAEFRTRGARPEIRRRQCQDAPIPNRNSNTPGEPARHVRRRRLVRGSSAHGSFPPREPAGRPFPRASASLRQMHHGEAIVLPNARRTCGGIGSTTRATQPLVETRA